MARRCSWTLAFTPRATARPGWRRSPVCPWAPGLYMSPEQVQFVRNDLRSDLFALGVATVSPATGERVLPASPARCVACAGACGWTLCYRAPLTRASRPGWEIILHRFEVKPERRYQSAAQLALDLREPDGVVLRPAPSASRSAAVAPLGGAGSGLRWGRGPKSSYQPGRAVGPEPDHRWRQWTSSTPPRPAQPVARYRASHRPDRGRCPPACVSVMKTNRIGVDELTDKAGNSLHVKQPDRPQTLGATHQQGLESGRWPADLPCAGGPGPGRGHHRLRDPQWGRPSSWARAPRRHCGAIWAACRPRWWPSHRAR